MPRRSRDGQPEDPAEQRQRHRLDEELPQHGPIGGADGLANADLLGTLRDHHQHDVHDDDAADDERHRDDRNEHRVDPAGSLPVDIDEGIGAGEAEVVGIAGAQPALDAHQQAGLRAGGVDLIDLARPDDDRVDPAAAEHALEGTDGHVDELVLADAEERSAPLVHADDDEVLAVDHDALVERGGRRQSGEELLRRVRPEDGDGAVAASFQQRKIAPHLDTEGVREVVLVRVPRNRDAIELYVAVFNRGVTRGRLHDSSEGRSLVAQQPRVAALDTRIPTRQALVELREQLAGADHTKHVGPLRGEDVGDFAVEPLDDRDHQDDRGHRDDVAEHGEERSELVGPDRLERDEDALADAEDVLAPGPPLLLAGCRCCHGSFPLFWPRDHGRRGAEPRRDTR